MRNVGAAMLVAIGCQSGAKISGTDPVDRPDTGAPTTGSGSGGSGGDTTGDDGIDRIEGRATQSPWLRDEETSPGSVTFTELYPHPIASDETEWVELHNPMVLDMDVSGWQLTGAVDWTFPEGTSIPAQGFVVVAADPAQLSVPALGPWDGRLANEGERLSVISRSGRTIDSVAYGTTPAWSILADGSGFSLAKRDHDAASDHAENWTASPTPGGSPGASNALDPHTPPVVLALIPPDAAWQVDASGTMPTADWFAPELDDTTWETLQAPIYGGPGAEVTEGTVWATADNYFAVYAGAADGSDLRLLGADTDGSWTTVDELPVELTATDHLFLAAWELTGDSSSPQMAIAELELPDDAIGTDATN